MEVISQRLCKLSANVNKSCYVELIVRWYCRGAYIETLSFLDIWFSVETGSAPVTASHQVPVKYRCARPEN